ncbi:MAG: hypothetical protein V3U86_06475, partial [Acidobacteriota bacterium]
RNGRRLDPMRPGSFQFTLLAVVLVCALGCATVPDSEQVGGYLPGAGFEIGQKFPDIVFPALEGERPLSLADFRGQKVLLHIFASW